MKGKLLKLFCILSICFSFMLPSFSFVKAATTDDLYTRLTQLVNILNGYTYHDGVNYNVSEIELLLNDIFDGRYSYMYDNQLQQNMTFQQLMQHLVSSNNTILQSIVYGHSEEVDGQTVYTPGLYDKVGSCIQILESIASSTAGGNATIISTLNSISSDLLNIKSNLQTIKDYCNTINSTLLDIKNADSAFYAYIQSGSFKSDLDNAIDTITWNNSLSITSDNFGIRVDGSSDDYINQSINLNNNDIAMRITLNNNFQYSERLFKIVLPYYVYSNSVNPFDLDISVYYPRYNFDIYYTSSRLSGLTIYLRMDVPQPITNLYFKITGNGTFTYLPNFTRTGIYYIESNDIEYWQLLSYFDLHSFYNAYVSVNSPERDQLDNKTDELSDLIDDINNLDTDIITDFNSQIVEFDLTVTNLSGQILNHARWLSTQLQRIYDISGPYKILAVLPMFLGIAILFIGRGLKR